MLTTTHDTHTHAPDLVIEGSGDYSFLALVANPRIWHRSQ